MEAYKLKFLDFYVLPIPDLLNAATALGKGVTICFIDSGFYLHPEIKERVLKTIDITNEAMKPNILTTPMIMPGMAEQFLTIPK